MPPPMMRRTRRLPIATISALVPDALRWRRGIFGTVVVGPLAGLFRGLAQNDPDLVLHRPAVARRAQPQQPFQLIVELADGEAGHGKRFSQAKHRYFSTQ